ncbi:hypothetical protein CLF_101184 [Clonorchis sinensis]|uniref:Endonuclease/exonuclease/phosphatase domain-containing protein n=1 Tax=Clonorchis sinensis TaxID=79923 RepID=G7Y571_CLOSI|nr:hypothetical protein CLF_101184 [Clonorchis sinensis]
MAWSPLQVLDSLVRNKVVVILIGTGAGTAVGYNTTIIGITAFRPDHCKCEYGVGQSGNLQPLIIIGNYGCLGNAEESLVDMEHADVVLIFKEEEKVRLFLSDLTKVIPPFGMHPAFTVQGNRDKRHRVQKWAWQLQQVFEMVENAYSYDHERPSLAIKFGRCGKGTAIIAGRSKGSKPGPGKPETLLWFVRQFEMYVERTVEEAGRSPPYLVQYCQDDAKAAIEICMTLSSTNECMPPIQYYLRAINNPHRLARAYGHMRHHCTKAVFVTWLEKGTYQPNAPLMPLLARRIRCKDSKCGPYIGFQYANDVHYLRNVPLRDNPSSPPEDDHFLIRTLGQLSSSYHFTHLLLVGDFNAPKAPWTELQCVGSSGPFTAALTEVVQQSAWTQHVVAPTRYRAGQQPSLLDLVITNERHFVDQKSAEKAFDVLRMIRRTFARITRMDFQILYGAYVRPLLEYANPVVYSGRTKHVTLIQRVQRAATKMVAGLKSVGYETRLAVLDFLPLEYRRLRGDLILTYALVYFWNTYARLWFVS